MANPNSEAVAAMGTYLRRNGVEIAEVVTIGGPSFEAETIEVTHLRSPGMWKEYIGSLKDGGELTFDLNFLLDDPSHSAATGLLSQWNSDGVPARDEWEIVFPNDAATVWLFNGFQTGFEVTAETGDKLAASVTIQISGKPTLA